MSRQKCKKRIFVTVIYYAKRFGKIKDTNIVKILKDLIPRMSLYAEKYCRKIDVTEMHKGMSAKVRKKRTAVLSKRALF